MRLRVQAAPPVQTPTPSTATGDPVQSVYTYWSYLQLGQIADAYNMFSGTERARVGGLQRYVDGISQDPPQQVNVNLSLGSESGSSATVDVDSLQTETASGCSQLDRLLSDGLRERGLADRLRKPLEIRLLTTPDASGLQRRPRPYTVRAMLRSRTTLLTCAATVALSPRRLRRERDYSGAGHRAAGAAALAAHRPACCRRFLRIYALARLAGSDP